MPDKVTIDQNGCIGCQLCADLLPRVFRMNTRGFAEVHDSHGAAAETVNKVIGACPKSCIHWEEAD